MLSSVVLVGLLVGAQEPRRAGAEPVPASLRAADFEPEFDRESTFRFESASNRASETNPASETTPASETNPGLQPQGGPPSNLEPTLDVRALALGPASEWPAPVFTSVSLTPPAGVSASITPIPVMRIAESASINTNHAQRATFRMDVYGQDRPRALLPLYISNVALGIADVATSAPAIRQGSRETNPVMASLDGSTWKMATVRMVGVGVTIWCVEAVRKRGHGRAAVIAMLAINAANVAIVAHNSSVLASATRMTRR